MRSAILIGTAALLTATLILLTALISLLSAFVAFAGLPAAEVFSLSLCLVAITVLLILLAWVPLLSTLLIPLVPLTLIACVVSHGLSLSASWPEGAYCDSTR